MNLVITAILGITFVGIGLVILIFSLRWLFRDELSPRLQTFVTDETQGAQRWSPVLNIRTRELSGSFFNRVLLPPLRKIASFLGRLTPAESIEKVSHQLYIAGDPLGLGPREFYGIRIVFTLIAVWIAFFILRSGRTQINILLAVLVFIMLATLPVLWLRTLVRKRQDMIRRGLPDALDMLSVCAIAGLGFDQSLRRVSEHWDTPIANELGRVVSEMEMGLSRREALRNLADRLDVSELSSFVSVIIQSEQLGMSIADTLHAQAEQMRIERRFRAQEIARTIPIKMLIPLAFLIFPALIAIIMGPAVPALLELFQNF
jgi:tight adherence protein C